jgi:hypothetical protein
LVRTVPVVGSQSNPPLQPPVAQEFGPGFEEKLHSVLPHILPAVQSYGTVKVTVAPEACSQPVGWDGTDFPAFRSVYKAGLRDVSVEAPYPRGLRSHQIVKGQWFTTVKVLDDPGPTLPEDELSGTGVVETVLGDDVIVTARVAMLRLREHVFILVEERGWSGFPGRGRSMYVYRVFQGAPHGGPPRVSRQGSVCTSFLSCAMSFSLFLESAAPPGPIKMGS